MQPRPRKTSRSEPPKARRWKVFWQRVRSFVAGPRILCDTCMYDYGSACTRPERPNATLCPDYAHR